MKYFTFGTNDEETRELERWRKESDRHEVLFRKIGSPDYLQQAMDPLHKKVLQEQWFLLDKKIRYTRRRKRMAFMIPAAVAVILSMVCMLVYTYTKQEEPVKKENLVNNESFVHSKAVIYLAEGGKLVVFKDSVLKMNVTEAPVENRLDTVAFLAQEVENLSMNKHRLEVPRGGEYVARLEDGTVVHMDAMSTLVIPQKFSKDCREVELIGHAYFSVAKDSTRPFVVRSGDLKVKVLGTEFDFNTYQGDIATTTLVRGSVEVAYLQSVYRLKPNQQAKVDSEGKIVVSDVDVYPYVAWKEERIVFINQTLGEIMRVLERWYSMEVVFLSNDIKQECFTLDIEKYGEINPVLKSIEKTNKVYFELVGNQILVYRK